MTDTPIIGAPDWAAAQASPWLTENKAKRMLEAMARNGIIVDRDLATPPGSCADGACYLIASSPTGAWVGNTGKMAIAVGANASNGWYFVTVATEGVELYVQDENIKIRYNGSSWVNAQAVGLAFAHQVGASSTTSELTVGSPAFEFEWPFNATMSAIHGFVGSAAVSSGPIVVDVELNGATVFSTLLTIDANERTSRSAATPHVLSTTAFVKGDVVSIYVDEPGDGAVGLILTFEGSTS